MNITTFLIFVIFLGSFSNKTSNIMLPLYIMDDTDEFGSKEGQEKKIRSGALEFLSKLVSSKCSKKIYIKMAYHETVDYYGNRRYEGDIYNIVHI